MKTEHINIHGTSLEEAMEKVKKNLAWCWLNDVGALVINHGKGRHSERRFSVLKQEIRRYLKNETEIKANGYQVIMGESEYPVALTFDAGITLVVKKSLVNDYIGGQRQQEKNKAVYSAEAIKQRKINKNTKRPKKGS